MCARVVPARAAYLIRARSRHGFRRAVQEASTRWGGATEPIVPVRAGGRVDGWWRQVIELSRPEGLVNVDVPGNDAALFAANIGMSLTPIELIDREGPTKWTCHPISVAASRWAKEDAPTVATRARSLWEVVAAGDLTAEQEQDLASSRLAFDRPHTEDWIARAQFSGSTILDYTVTSFGEESASNGPWPSPAIVWVTRPNSLSDALWFWNLRALRSLRFDPVPMILVPDRGPEQWLGLRERTHDILARTIDVSPDVALCTLSAPDKRLEEIASVLDLTETNEKPRVRHQWPPPPPRRAPFTYRRNLDPRQWFTFGRRYGQSTEVVTQLFTEKTIIEFDSPVLFHRQQGYTLLRLGGSAFASLPRREVTAGLVIQNAKWRDEALEIATSAQRHYRFEMHIPTLDHVIDVILRQATTDYALSDKGRLAAGLTSRAEISHLLAPGAYEAIRILTTPRAADLAKALERASDADESARLQLAAQWGGRGRRRYRSAQQLESSDVWPKGSRASDVLEDLVGVGWAERGAEVDCGRCGLKSFVPMERLDDKGLCPGCRHRQGYTVHQGTFAVFYRLDTMVDRCSDQGVLPHLLVIASLCNRERDTRFLPGLTVNLPDGRTRETDIFGVASSKVLSGEVKTSPIGFTRSQLEGDIALSEVLAADVHVVATLGRLSAETRRTAERLAGRTTISVMCLDGNDLRPVP